MIKRIENDQAPPGSVHCIFREGGKNTENQPLLGIKHGLKACSKDVVNFVPGWIVGPRSVPLV